MNVLEVLKACTLMIANGYHGVEVAGILRNVANEIDPKGAAALLDYNVSTPPQNELHWQVFLPAWRTIFKRDNPLAVSQGLNDTHKIGAIKAFRELTGQGLKESKDFVDANWKKFSL